MGRFDLGSVRGLRRLAGVICAAAVAALAALAPAASAKPPIFGVVPQDGGVPSAAEMEQMAAGGVDQIRLIMHWASVEQTRGHYDWSGIDAMVRETTNHGVEPYFFIYSTPAWASALDGRAGCAALACSVDPPRSNETRRAFAQFAAAAIDRYGPGGDFWARPGGKAAAALDPAAVEQSARDVPCLPIPIPACTPLPPPVPPPSNVPGPGEPPCGCTTPHPLRTWQIWNEQNSPKYFGPKVDVKVYAKLVKTAGAAIKQADPGAEVVLGGMWGPASAKGVVRPIAPYLSALYRTKGIEKSFDSIALHPYAANTSGSLDQLEAARKVLIRSGDPKVGVWITELGWASAGPTTNPYVKGLDGQAKLLSSTLGKFEQKRRRFNLRGIFWYSWRDKAGGESICEWCGYAGLRALDGTAKPAWDAFTRLAMK